MLPEHFASHNNSVNHSQRELRLRLSSKHSTHPWPAKSLLSDLILGRTPGYMC